VGEEGETDLLKLCTAFVKNGIFLRKRTSAKDIQQIIKE
jgi:hypothetical protein